MNQGINYFKINWLNNDIKKINKIVKNSFFSKLKMFFELANQNHSPILVHCSNGQGRSFVIMSLYLISNLLIKDRYKWSFFKTLEYLDSRKSNMEIKTNFFDALREIGNKLEAKNETSTKWENNFKSKYLNEEITISNTFLNSKNLFIKNSFSIQKQNLVSLHVKNKFIKEILLKNYYRDINVELFENWRKHTNYKLIIYLNTQKKYVIVSSCLNNEKIHKITKDEGKWKYHNRSTKKVTWNLVKNKNFPLNDSKLVSFEDISTKIMNIKERSQLEIKKKKIKHKIQSLKKENIYILEKCSNIQKKYLSEKKKKKKTIQRLSQKSNEISFHQRHNSDTLFFKNISSKTPLNDSLSPLKKNENNLSIKSNPIMNQMKFQNIYQSKNISKDKIKNNILEANCKNHLSGQSFFYRKKKRNKENSNQHQIPSFQTFFSDFRSSFQPNFNFQKIKKNLKLKNKKETSIYQNLNYRSKVPQKQSFPELSPHASSSLNNNTVSNLDYSFPVTSKNIYNQNHKQNNKNQEKSFSLSPKKENKNKNSITKKKNNYQRFSLQENFGVNKKNIKSNEHFSKALSSFKDFSDKFSNKNSSISFLNQNNKNKFLLYKNKKKIFEKVKNSLEKDDRFKKFLRPNSAPQDGNYN